MKRIQKLFSMVLLFVLTLCITVSADAELPRLVDDADLLSDAEESSLLAALDEISERQEQDIVVVTTESLDGKTATAYADDFFDYNGYGLGDTRDGILFLISMEDRDWAISTRGYAITAFTDYGQRYMMEEILPYLSAGEYYDAFMTFANLADSLITEADNGTPLDDYSDPDDYDGDDVYQTPYVTYTIIALLIGFVLSFIPVSVMKHQLKSVRTQNNADQYAKAESLDVQEANDIFLYTSVSREEIPQESDSDSGGGGSSTHTSSSGATHGGSSGKF